MKNNKTIQPPEDILKITNLHKRYNEGKSNEVHALRGVDLTVKKGDMMAIMGASGCGKTTLLNMIGNLDRRSSGQIIIDGVDTSKLSDGEKTAFRRDKIGFIFQLFNLFPFLTAVENVETPLLLRGLNSGLAREQAKMMLRELGIGDRLYHLPKELSGGQQQRVAIARALINQPAIILGDEPTGDLRLFNKRRCHGSFPPNQQSQPTDPNFGHAQPLDCRKMRLHRSHDRWQNLRHRKQPKKHGDQKMKAYYSALIDKSALSENAKLSKNLAETLKRNLKTRKSKIQRKEINTFIFLSAEKQLQKTIDSKTIEQTQEKLQKQLQEYYTQEQIKA